MLSALISITLTMISLFPGLNPLTHLPQNLSTSMQSFVTNAVEGSHIVVSAQNVQPTVMPIPIVLPTATATPSPTPTLAPTPTVKPTPRPTRKPRPKPTPTQTVTPLATVVTTTPDPTPKPGPLDMQGLFTQYANQYHVDRAELVKIAMCESGLNPSSSFDGYGGMFQFAAQTWETIRAIMGESTDPGLRFNASAAIKTAAFMLSRGEQDSWPSCH